MYIILCLHLKINRDSVAQLGERYLDRVEVAGSRPVGIILNRGLYSLKFKGYRPFFC